MDITRKREHLLKMLSGKGIEIGALHRPCQVPHLRVQYVDLLTKDELLRHYPELQGHNIVEPHIIDDGQLLTKIADSSQDFVIANHVIEHMRDPLMALKNWARVLRPGGKLFLAVPDKHTSFDHDRGLTSLEHLLLDHEQPSEERDFEHFRDFALKVSCQTFGVKPEAEADSFAKELWDTRYSIHYHVWDFDSFKALLAYVEAHIFLCALRLVGESEPELQEFIFLYERV